MIKDRLIELKDTLENAGIIISFSGPFSQGIIQEVGEAIRKNMMNEETLQKSIYNVLSIFVEQTQNIRNYISSKQTSKYFDIIANSNTIAISRDDRGYSISAVNVVENGDLNQLVKRLKRLEALDKEELKVLYKEQINKEVPPDSYGAGLGLIDIARKSSHPISYLVREYSDELSYFLLSAIV